MNVVKKVATIAVALLSPLAQGGATELANDPFLRTGGVPPPNIMLGFDTSGSMGLAFLPDHMNRSSLASPVLGNVIGGVCKTANKNPFNAGSLTYADLDNRSLGLTGWAGEHPGWCNWGDPPLMSSDINGLYYNPKIRYRPPPRGDGTFFPDVNPNDAPSDGFGFGTAYTFANHRRNLTTQFFEMVYCRSESDRNDLDGPNCRRNGIGGVGYAYPDNVNKPGNTGPVPWYGPYNPGVAPAEAPDPAPGEFSWGLTRLGAPYYYRLQPTEYCRDVSLTDCVAANAAAGDYSYPVFARYCRDKVDAFAPPGVTGMRADDTPRCISSYVEASYKFSRIPGTWHRVDIVPSGAPFPGGDARLDCADSASCTYSEELQNFANWYSYYRTRLQAAKSVVGHTMAQLPDTVRAGVLGFGTPGSGSAPIGTPWFNVPIAPWTQSARTNLLSKLYGDSGQTSNTTTRQVLSMIGRYYGGTRNFGPGSYVSFPQDPVIASCQKNFALIVTDGYWNTNPASNLSGGPIGNTDNQDSGYSKRSDGAYDGGIAGATNSLSDTAMYYYTNDLRPNGSMNTDINVDVSIDNVPTTTSDTAAHQHMNTYGISLAGGLMAYQPDYATATSGHFYDIKQGATGRCFWASGGTCNWPLPQPDKPSAVDDLWHASVNGRGYYYQARNTNELALSLHAAFTRMQAVGGGASAAAISAPTVSDDDNFVYSATYTTSDWTGDLQAYSINVTTAAVSTTPLWSASAQLQLDQRPWDSRAIFTSNASGIGSQAFEYASLGALQPAVSNRCASFSHCAVLTSAQRVIANNGTALVNFLRGSREHEGKAFRERAHVLGDMINSEPVVVGPPKWQFTDNTASESYGAFKSRLASRRKVIYVGGNDGMLHAFQACASAGCPSGGRELWAWVPRTVIPELFRLADKTYARDHRYFVDGSPVVMDVVIGNQWRTVLVAGFGAGGRGYFALDITDPDAPTGLWEICADSAVCATESNMGYSLGRATITKRPDGTWVALLPSGHNNVPANGMGGSGQGVLFVVDIATGNVLDRLQTGEGSTTDPSGLAHISAWTDDFAKNNTSPVAYGGDLKGNVWRFDLSGASPAVLKIAALSKGGRFQPVTTRPELVMANEQRVVLVGTGQLLAAADAGDPDSGRAVDQTFYAIKDRGIAHGDPRTNPKFIERVLSSSTTGRTISGGAVDWRRDDGWFMDFNPGGASPGERVALVPPVVIDGTLVIHTDMPRIEACASGGTSWQYALDFSTGDKTNSDLQANGVVGVPLTSLVVGFSPFRSTSPTGEGRVWGVRSDMEGKLRAGDIPLSHGPGAVRRILWREVVGG